MTWWSATAPKESAGIKILVRMSEELTASVQTLSELLGTHPEEHPRLVESMHTKEAQSNELFFALLTTMRSTIITRFPREILYQLGTHLNAAIEHLDTTADTICLLEISHHSTRAAELLEIIQQMAENTSVMLSRLNNLGDLEDLWVDNLRLAKRAEHTHLAWLKDTLSSTTSSTKQSLMAQRMLEVVHEMRKLCLLIGEIIVRES